MLKIVFFVFCCYFLSYFYFVDKSNGSVSDPSFVSLEASMKELALSFRNLNWFLCSLISLKRLRKRLVRGAIVQQLHCREGHLGDNDVLRYRSLNIASNSRSFISISFAILVISTQIWSKRCILSENNIMKSVKGDFPNLSVTVDVVAVASILIL